MQFRGVYKSFGGQKGGSLEPPRTPPAYGPVLILLIDFGFAIRLVQFGGFIA